MAGTNDFKAFATDANANVTSQEEWETLTALKKGFSSGKASSAQVSKALRQPSTMAAVLGQFIANAELDALDDGDVDGLVAKLATAITTNIGLGASAFGLKNFVVFSTAGVSTWTVPDELKSGRKAKVTVIGAGGSGGRSSSGGGGGGGGKAVKLVDLTGIESVPITVGAGGAKPAAGSTSIPGNSGGSSSFGTFCSATGGSGGVNVSGGLPGIGVNGDINTTTGPGNPGANHSSGSYVSGSGGGAGGSGSLSSSNNDGFDAMGPGGGGAGAATGSTTVSCRPGAGYSGLVLIEW
ncbi:glycine-rich domain-containing protein (plasmid) [Escherichia coli]